jgi:hypothetical protein
MRRGRPRKTRRASMRRGLTTYLRRSLRGDSKWGRRRPHFALSGDNPHLGEESALRLRKMREARSERLGRRDVRDVQTRRAARRTALLFAQGMASGRGTERRGGNRRFEGAIEVRALSELFFRASPVRVTPHRTERRKVGRPRRSKPSVRLRFHNRSFHSFHNEVGMNSGPSRAARSPLSPEPVLPGEFVSEQLRTDCARFLDEQRRLVGLRRKLPPEGAAWVPGLRRPAGQSPPNSRAEHSGQ